MSDRERWIVYPLLFLALGIGVRGKFAPSHRIEADYIRADDLRVTDVLRVKKIHCEEIDARNIRCTSNVCEQSQVISEQVIGPDLRNPQVRMRSASLPALDEKTSPQRSGVVGIYGDESQPVVVLSGLSYGEVILNAPAPGTGVSLTPHGSFAIPGFQSTRDRLPGKAPPEKEIAPDKASGAK